MLEIPNLNDMAFLIGQMCVLSSQDEQGLRNIAKEADKHALALHNSICGRNIEGVVAAMDFLRKLAAPGTIKE